MRFDLKQATRTVTACVLATLFTMPTNLLAQAHVVSPALGSDIGKGSKGSCNRQPRPTAEFGAGEAVPLLR